MDWWKKYKKKGIILKLDFEKAYDSINKNYLWSLLTNFGFGDLWVSCMQKCVTTAIISILVNGSLTNEFSPSKGLRQGDPLSPFLFNIAAEGLTMLLVRAKEMGLIKGVSVGQSEFLITHLQFADDTLLFCEAEEVELVTIKRILRCFEIISGFKINFHKSVLCGIGIDETLSQAFATKLKCKCLKLPIKYLGLPLRVNTKRSKSW